MGDRTNIAVTQSHLTPKGAECGYVAVVPLAGGGWLCTKCGASGLRADPDTSDEPDWDRIFDRLPKVCPTCTSDEPTTYYGSCFDNQHSTIFDPRLPMDPWHAYMVELRHLLRQVDNLDTYVKIGREMLERAGAERDAERAARERAEAEARQLREAVMEAATELGLTHEPEWASPAAKEKGLNPVWCAICGSADGSWPCTSQMVLDDLLAAVAEGAEDRGQTDAS